MNYLLRILGVLGCLFCGGWKRGGGGWIFAIKKIVFVWILFLLYKKYLLEIASFLDNGYRSWSTSSWFDFMSFFKLSREKMVAMFVCLLPIWCKQNFFPGFIVSVFGKWWYIHVVRGSLEICNLFYWLKVLVLIFCFFL